MTSRSRIRRAGGGSASNVCPRGRGALPSSAEEGDPTGLPPKHASPMGTDWLRRRTAYPDLPEWAAICLHKTDACHAGGRGFETAVDPPWSSSI
jgi:hypothetical protein